MPPLRHHPGQTEIKPAYLNFYEESDIVRRCEEFIKKKQDEFNNINAQLVAGIRKELAPKKRLRGEGEGETSDEDASESNLRDIIAQFMIPILLQMRKRRKRRKSILI